MKSSKTTVKSFTFLGVVAALAGWADVARSGEKTICVQIDTQFNDEDGAPGEEMGKYDTMFGNINTNSLYYQRARGVKITMYPNQGDQEEVMYATDGSQGGCITIEVGDNVTTIPLEISAEARVNGMRLESYAQTKRCNVTAFEIPIFTTSADFSEDSDFVLIVVDAANISCDDPNYDVDIYDPYCDEINCHPGEEPCLPDCSVPHACGWQQCYDIDDGPRRECQWYSDSEDAEEECNLGLVDPYEYCAWIENLDDTGNPDDYDCLPSEWSKRHAWHQLTVGMYAMYRTAWDLSDYGAVCGYDGNWYTPIGEPEDIKVQWPDDLIAFYATHPSPGGGNAWPAPNFFSETDRVEGTVRTGTTDKFVIAHELGHMLVEVRMGGFTHQDTTAPTCGCDGGGRYLSRVYSSNAAREGWADFFSAWLWNTTEEGEAFENCRTKTSSSTHDFDLDDFSDVRYDMREYNGLMACGEGAGPIPGVDYTLSANPYSLMYSSGDWYKAPEDRDDEDWLKNREWILGPDWLKSACDNDKCGVINVDYDPAEDPECETNYLGVSTKHDWAHYYWGMAIDEGVPIQELSRIHVDMCPVDQADAPVWLSSSVGGSGDWNDTPECRAELAAIFHGVGDAHFSQNNKGVAHYPTGFVCNSSLFDPICGDGVCGGSESSDSCREDCAWQQGLFDSYTFGPLTIEKDFTYFGVYGVYEADIHDRASVFNETGSGHAHVGAGGWEIPGYSYYPGYIFLGDEAEVGELHAGGSITIRGGTANGDVYTKLGVIAQAGSTFGHSIYCGGEWSDLESPIYMEYEGTINYNYPFAEFRDSVPRYIAWDIRDIDFENYARDTYETVQIPAWDTSSVTLQPKESYRGQRIQVRSGGEINLGPGVYYFASLSLEPEAVMTLDTSDGAIFIFVDEDISIKSRSTVGGDIVDASKVMFVSDDEAYLGCDIEWNGTLITRNFINLERNTSGIRGMFYSDSVEIHQDTRIGVVPFGMDLDQQDVQQLYYDALVASGVEIPDSEQDADTDTDSDTDTDADTETTTPPAPPEPEPQIDPIVFDGQSGEIVVLDLAALGGAAWLYTDTWPGYDNLNWNANVCIAVQQVNGQQTPDITVNVESSGQSTPLSIGSGWYTQVDIPDSGPYTLQVQGSSGVLGLGLCNY